MVELREIHGPVAFDARGALIEWYVQANGTIEARSVDTLGQASTLRARGLNSTLTPSQTTGYLALKAEENSQASTSSAFDHHHVGLMLVLDDDDSRLGHHATSSSRFSPSQQRLPGSIYLRSISNDQTTIDGRVDRPLRCGHTSLCRPLSHILSVRNAFDEITETVSLTLMGNESGILTDGMTDGGQHGWNVGNIGMSVVGSFGAVVLTNITNTSHAYASRIHGSGEGLFYPDNWYLLDIRNEANLLSAGPQTGLTLYNHSTLRWPVLVAQSTVAHVGLKTGRIVMLANGGWGWIVQEINSTTSLLYASDHRVRTGQTFYAREGWGIYTSYRSKQMGGPALDAAYVLIHERIILFVFP